MSRMANIGTVYVLLMLRQILKSQKSNKQYMEFVILCFVDKALKSLIVYICVVLVHKFQSNAASSVKVLHYTESYTF